MQKRSIDSAIIKRIESSKKVDYSVWRIGITHDPEERKRQHRKDGKSTTYWKQWTADSLSDAEEIESHFINDLGLEGGTGGNLSDDSTVYVYIL